MAYRPNMLPIAADDPLWRLAERVEVETVPSWFPVEFSLLTHGQRQYAAYYDAKHQMTVAVRALGRREWRTVKLDSKVGWDSHNGITMACDGNGDLHVSGNMHCVPLICFRTETPGDITALKRLPMTGRDELRCTYPRFLRDAKSRLVFHYRDGGARLAFDSRQRPMLVYHKSDAQGNMQIYAARFADGQWARSAITAWDKPVKFSGYGSMPFIGISVSKRYAVTDLTLRSADPPAEQSLTSRTRPAAGKADS